MLWYSCYGVFSYYMFRSICSFSDGIYFRLSIELWLTRLGTESKLLLNNWLAKVRSLIALGSLFHGCSISLETPMYNHVPECLIAEVNMTSRLCFSFSYS
jgi:hypothetical protein